jgi:hypothetical protein
MSGSIYRVVIKAHGNKVKLKRKNSPDTDGDRDARFSTVFASEGVFWLQVITEIVEGRHSSNVSCGNARGVEPMR